MHVLSEFKWNSAIIYFSLKKMYDDSVFLYILKAFSWNYLLVFQFIHVTILSLSSASNQVMIFFSCIIHTKCVILPHPVAWKNARWLIIFHYIFEHITIYGLVMNEHIHYLLGFSCVWTICIFDLSNLLPDLVVQSSAFLISSLGFMHFRCFSWLSYWCGTCKPISNKTILFQNVIWEMNSVLENN